MISQYKTLTALLLVSTISACTNTTKEQTYQIPTTNQPTQQIQTPNTQQTYNTQIDLKIIKIEENTGIVNIIIPKPIKEKKITTHQKLTQLIQALPLDYLTEGVAQRGVDIKQRVQTGRGCPKDNYIFWDFNNNILGYAKIPHKDKKGKDYTKQQIKDKINQYRTNFENPVLAQVHEIGYPYTGNCSGEYQVKFEYGVSSYYETHIKGNWSKHSIESLTSIRDVIRKVYKTKKESGEVSFPHNLFEYTLGQYVFEAGGKKKLISKDGAKGIFQIMDDNMKRVCKNPMINPYHRIAQIDCVFSIHEKNYQLIKPNFDTLFGDLPKKKYDELISLLTLQAYHTGQNKINRLLDQTRVESKVAKYLALHQNEFSAADIAHKFIFHNAGGIIGYQSYNYDLKARNALNELKMRKSKYIK